MAREIRRGRRGVPPEAVRRASTTVDTLAAHHPGRGAFGVAAQGIALLPALGGLAQARGWQVGELQAYPPTLEEIFLALTEPQESTSSAGA